MLLHPPDDSENIKVLVEDQGIGMDDVKNHFLID